MQAAAQAAEREPADRSVLLRHVRAQAARRALTLPDRTAAPEPPPPAPARSPERAVANAIGRAADRVHGLPLFFDKVETGHAVLAELGELLPDPALISVVEGPGDALGVVAICPGLLTSVIEMQAVGRISGRSAPARRPTRTDGAICADFLNACLAELGAELAGQAGFNGIAGYRYASFLEDARPLELLLDEVPFRRISVTLRAGAAGQRDGRMVLLLPARPQAAAIPAAVESGAAEGGAAAAVAAAPPPAGVLSDAVHAAPITLSGILCRRMISLGELQALVPGATITLPPDVLDAATLETAAGQQLFRGKLGELSGRHALRLRPVDERPAGSQQFGAVGDFADGADAGGEGAAGAAGSAFMGQSDPLSGPADAPVPLGAFGMQFPAPQMDSDRIEPIDLEQPDPFRPAAADFDASDLGSLAAPAAMDFPAADLSAWEDEPVPLAPLSIG